MLLRNFKSSADEVSKRNLAEQLLKVEIENEAVLEDRIGNYQNPNAPPPVPPQYKTNSQLQQDTLLQEKTAIDNLLSMDFDYNDATNIVKWLGTGDALIKFNQGFPFIKSDITKKFNPKLVDASFMKDYLTKYFEEVNVSFGFSFDKNGEIAINNLSELKDILPSRQSIEGLAQQIDTAGGVHIDGEVLADITNELHALHNALPTDEEIAVIETLNQYQRIQLLKLIANAVRKAGVPRPAEIIEFQIKLEKYQAMPQSIAQLGKNLARRLSTLTPKKLKDFEEIRKQIHDLSPVPEHFAQEELPDISDEIVIDEDAPVMQMYPDEEYDIRQIEKVFARNEAGNWSNVYAEAIKLMDNLGIDRLDESITRARLQDAIDTKKKIKAIANHKITTAVRDVMQQVIANRPEPYHIEDRVYYTLPKEYQPNKGYKGFGLGEPIGKNGMRPRPIGLGMKTATAVKKHFKEDEKFLKKVAKELDDSSSDEETMKSLKKHAKAEKPYEAKIEKAVGAGYIHKRIPVKKIVGKGIEVQEQPTYKTFGKYVMHIPHLLNNNVLNLKYPSLGSIPSIKPMTISEDYKDFVIDVMNTGRVNDKAYTQLQPHERKHFERITKGAGLIDTFKLKKSTDDDDKADEDRFNLLRGNYLGGNNSESVVKELKALVVKFMSEGRIHRNEGLNLLMELSVM